MKFVRSFRAPHLFALLGSLSLPGVARAQDPDLPGAPANVPASSGAANRLSAPIRTRISQGRALYDAGDERAVAVLREAAQSALASLTQIAGQNPLAADAKSLPNDSVTANLAQSAGEAHFYWGLAADHFARRDESITALSRAVRLSRALAGAPVDSGLLRRDSSLELGRVLRGGLPLVAPDDTLDNIASLAHGGLWTPKRISFEAAALSGGIGGATIPKTEFLVTDGKLFPPTLPGSNDLSRIPPYYANVPAESLPAALQLDKMVAGYERQAKGPNRGQWRQVARVLYASPFLTQNRRDDLPRARALCEQFLRVHAVFQDALGATNLYTRGDRDEGVTTLWLLETSALWPEDDDDPSILAQLGAKMPGVNTGAEKTATEAVTTATQLPWMGQSNMALAGQAESQGGEIMFWKAPLARPETEWLREVFHEYGHVALPPLGGFRPPLEPYGNGLMGETLGQMWAAQAPERFGITASQSAGLETQVANQALPALRFFLAAGPNSPLRASGSRDGLRYLQGLTTYLERVYGARMLGRALAPLANRAASVDDVATRRALMNSSNLLDAVDFNWNRWSGKTLPIYLSGALATARTADNLIGRENALLRAGSRTGALLYVPRGTESLRIEGASQLRAVGLPFVVQGGALKVYFAGRSGWQSFSLVAKSDTRVGAARFERK